MKGLLISLLLVSRVLTGYGQTAVEKEAIKKVIEKDAVTWRNGDVQGHADCWLVRPYSRILVSTADGRTLDVPPEAMIHPASGLMGKGGFAIQSNYKMSVHGNNAWVSHNEVSTSRDGQKSYSYEIRMLEKISGRWKLVAQSVHLYKLKQK